MPPAPISLARRLAVLAGVLVLTVGTIGSASAASPHAFTPRNGGNAWDGDGTAQTDRVIVTFKPGTTGAQRAQAAKALGLTNGRGIRGMRAGAYRLDPAVTSAARATLPASVESISPDLRMTSDLDPTDEPGWGYLWGLRNTGQPILGHAGTSNIDIDGLEAYSISQGDPAVVVAVIDDGVDFGHPDLAARAWTNPGESGGGMETDGVDNDGNGYIDDVHGWDFCNGDNTVHDFDEDFHGTHVAGTIAASLDGQGVVGVAPNVKIMALKFIDPTQPSCSLTSLAMEAIAYAKSFGVVISNNSYGLRGRAKDFTLFANAIANSGMLFVTSAGNDGIDNDTDLLPAFPASFDLPNVITVAAADQDGGLADFSNYGKTTVDISAPGVNILSSVPIDSAHPNPAEQWEWFSGTSMASPHAAGVAALLASQDPAFRVSAGVTALRAKLLAASKSLPLTAGETVTGRMVDARFVLDTVAPAALAPNSHAFSVGSVLGTSTISTIVGWPGGTDDSSGIRNYTLEQQVNAGGWATAVSGTTARTAARSLAFNTSNQFRVKAMDRAGNVSGVMTGPAVRPVLYQETTSLATYGGTWSSTTSASASAGHLRYATRAGGYVSFRFTGRAVGVVAPKGPTRGSAKVYVDNVYAGAISLYRSASVSRSVVFEKHWSASGTHTVKLVLVGTSGRPRVDIDAFAILR